MGVYGDQLACFQELFEGFNNYSMKPEIVAGRKPREFIKSFRGVIQDLKAGELDRDGNTINETAVPTLWTREKLKAGTFVQPQDESRLDEIYIVNKSNKWKKEGDFYLYTLELEVASTDSQKPNTDFSYGVSRFD